MNLHVVPHANLPASVDWTCSGVLSPVRSQGKVSSCWAFVTAEMIETGLKIFRGETVAVSTQELLDFCPNKRERGGKRIYGLKYVALHGICLEKDYPYEGVYSSRERRQKMVDKLIRGHRVRIKSCIKVDKDEISLMYAVAQQPVGVGICVGNQLMRCKKGNIYDGMCQKLYKSPTLKNGWTMWKLHEKPNHSVLIVGYGTTNDGRKYWLVKNSWGVREVGLSTEELDSGFVFRFPFFILWFFMECMENGKRNTKPESSSSADKPTSLTA
ncbi:senescence-specific cysteine protease SAG39 [Trifolium repens]|nr:senescence-specific cysteine protease SAG39 [Trifolium repens]